VIHGVKERAVASCFWTFAGRNKLQQGFAHGCEVLDLSFKLGYLLRSKGLGCFTVGGTSGCKVEERLDLLQPESEALGRLDEAHGAHRIGVVGPIS
jgi:hypothetical protein